MHTFRTAIAAATLASLAALAAPARAIDVAVGGGIVAGVFAGIKSTANDNYINVQNQIINAQKADGIKNPTCSPPPSRRDSTQRGAGRQRPSEAPLVLP